MTEAGRARTALLRTVFAIVPPLTHVAQGLLMLALGPPFYALAALSALAVAWFGVAGWLMRAGRAHLATWMIAAEILTHSAVLHAAFGPDARIGVYPWVLAAASLSLFPADELRSRWSAFALAATVGAAELFPWRPAIHSERAIVEGLGALNLATGIACLVVFALALVTATERAERQAEAEHRRAEALLGDLLPAPIAARLKSGGGAIADHVPEVTVLFADLVGFTPLAAGRPPGEVVALLDRAFSAFDAIAREHGLEKIKTIGDAWLGVAGLPEPHPDGPAAAARAALALVAATRALSEEVGVPLALRVGLHTGPVVAGVIGSRRRAYDLWGDTVNTASRMESHGEGGRVHVSAATAERLRGRFSLEPRGRIAVKGKGELETWWLTEGPPP